MQKAQKLAPPKHSTPHLRGTRKGKPQHSGRRRQYPGFDSQLLNEDGTGVINGLYVCEVSKGGTMLSILKPTSMSKVVALNLKGVDVNGKLELAAADEL